MESDVVLLICYALLGLINTYCFLFQRTVRKIRQFAIGTQGSGLEKYFYPEWVFTLYYISHIRYVPLIWLFIINWEWAAFSVFVLFVLKMSLSENDYRNIQIIKRNFQDKKYTGELGEYYEEFFSWILKAEEETLKEPEPTDTKKEMTRYFLGVIYLIIFAALFYLGRFIYSNIFN